MTSLTLEEEVEIGLSNEERKVLRDMGKLQASSFLLYIPYLCPFRLIRICYSPIEHRLALAPDVEEEDRDDLLVESQVPPRRVTNV